MASVPEKPKKPLTRKGYQKLAAEHDELLLVERPKVVQGIATAAAEGARGLRRAIDARRRELAG